MKTKYITTLKFLFLLAALIGLQIGSTYAAGNLTEVSVLSPRVPAVADFSDGAPNAEVSARDIAPVTPKEASFEDSQEATGGSAVQALAPRTPDQADFEDQI